ncbi:pseudouridine-5'-phosphate glycosidase [Pararhizobium haloflavum]|uniref:pseudouridine-5'-phosphate glycosidase n=1 Tax=Pararhizobium haloflavum TaxID=2037914 RepID=UPI000C176D93|nr:pseudouridine-5'-phosphate glycosidase [Pararhizobium haloflavum]
MHEKPRGSLPLQFSPAVEAARREGRPIVALESTIITHGMPFPDNLAMARGVEDIVREEGAEPATIAILDGTVHVGLTDDQLAALARAEDVLKVSRADLAFAVAEGRNGATTVAATMIVAALADISIFATGGIGGVHRGAESSFDISADLEELARTPVLVVCAGAKAILDIPKTLEVLETRGVPVVTFGADRFPAFWSRDSGLGSPLRLDTPDAIARFCSTRTKLGLSGGVLVANPVPEANEIAREEMERHIAEALRRAEEKGVAGKAVTPFLLGAIFEITGGASLSTNVALVRHNARLAARIAVAVGPKDRSAGA